ncbi:MAG TPA: hypothetical protein VHS09_14630, partial [Polyangiaceae bacterium]|nr:hypothetical protein [Polyangiaceae bacterium]
MLSTKTVFSALAITSLTALAASGCAVATKSQPADESSSAEDVNRTESDVESLGRTFIGGDGASLA